MGGQGGGGEEEEEGGGGGRAPDSAETIVTEEAVTTECNTSQSANARFITVSLPLLLVEPTFNPASANMTY